VFGQAFDKSLGDPLAPIGRMLFARGTRARINVSNPIASECASPSIGAEWKRPKAALPMAITTLVLATTALGIGGYIAYAGGHIRHKEFRFEPAPELRTEGASRH
jgi:hypothetical protein